MSERSKRSTQVARHNMLRPQPMPTLPAVPATGGALVPFISSRELGDFTRDINSLREITGSKCRDSKESARKEQELARRKQALQPRFQALDRPASNDEIASQAAILVTAYPNLARAEVDLFSATLADDIAAERPSAYELAEACRAVRRKHEFLSVAAVIKELRWQKKMTYRIRYLLTATGSKSGLLSAAKFDYWASLDASVWAEGNKE